MDPVWEDWSIQPQSILIGPHLKVYVLHISKHVTYGRYFSWDLCSWFVPISLLVMMGTFDFKSFFSSFPLLACCSNNNNLDIVRKLRKQENYSHISRCQDSRHGFYKPGKWVLGLEIWRRVLGAGVMRTHA